MAPDWALADSHLVNIPEGSLASQVTTPDFSAFEAELGPAIGEAGPERRLRGALRYADGGSSFTLDEVDYRCE